MQAIIGDIPEDIPIACVHPVAHVADLEDMLSFCRVQAFLLQPEYMFFVYCKVVVVEGA